VTPRNNTDQLRVMVWVESHDRLEICFHSNFGVEFTQNTSTSAGKVAIVLYCVHALYTNGSYGQL
jgi:hypothetical protein